MKPYTRKKVLGNGKVVVRDFYDLRPDDFETIHGEMSRRKMKECPFLVSPDGKYFVNTRYPLAEFISGVLDVLVRETKETLSGYEERMRNKYPEIKNFTDWENMKGTNEDRTYVFSMLMTPIELNRRKIEQNYY